MTIWWFNRAFWHSIRFTIKKFYVLLLWKFIMPGEFFCAAPGMKRKEKNNNKIKQWNKSVKRCIWAPHLYIRAQVRYGFVSHRYFHEIWLWFIVFSWISYDLKTEFKIERERERERERGKTNKSSL